MQNISLAGLKKIACRRDGAVLPLLAVVITGLVLVSAMTLDIARAYTLQNKLQQASDAALLGAVATLNTNHCADTLQTGDIEKVTCEVKNIFRSNAETAYLDSTTVAGTFKVSKISEKPDVYELNFDVRIPMAMMGGFGMPPIEFHVLSQVQAGFDRPEPGVGPQLEVTLVVDTTESMLDCPAGPTGVPCGTASKLAGLQAAALKFIDVMFGSSAELPDVWVSVVPYDMSVNAQRYGKSDWLQNAAAPLVSDLRSYNDCLPLANCAAAGGTLAPPAQLLLQNRDPSDPVSDPSFNDVSDVAPNTADQKTLFHMVRFYVNGIYSPVAFRLLGGTSPMLARTHKKQDAVNAINGLTAQQATRIPVGLMWGWFTLSPNWKGIWPNGDPVRYHDEKIKKVMVLMTDGRNEVGNITVKHSITGVILPSELHYNATQDDKTTQALCDKIKENGIDLYTIAFGVDSDQTKMKECVGKDADTHFSYASDNETLMKVLARIADKQVYETMRLTK